MTDAKMLFIDIETAPALVYTYDLWQPVIGHRQIVESSRMICFSAQWYGTKKTMFFSEYHDGRMDMLEELWSLLTEADVVVGYNSSRFDTPWVLGELMTEGFPAPAPFKQVDLFQVIKRNSRFLSKKLDYVSQRLLGDNKIDVNTMQLALQCLSDDPETARKGWNLMQRYSKKDTALMLPLFDRIRSYVKLPLPIFSGDDRCMKCGSYELQLRGTAKTNYSEYQRFVCKQCGTWGRYQKRESLTNVRNIA